MKANVAGLNRLCVFRRKRTPIPIHIGQHSWAKRTAVGAKRRSERVLTQVSDMSQGIEVVFCSRSPNGATVPEEACVSPRRGLAGAGERRRGGLRAPARLAAGRHA